jgi:hypothetical protein
MITKIVNPKQDVDKINLDNLRQSKIVIAHKGNTVQILTMVTNRLWKWCSLYSTTENDIHQDTVKLAISSKLDDKWDVYHCGSTTNLVETLIKIKGVDIKRIADNLGVS